MEDQEFVLPLYTATWRPVWAPGDPVSSQRRFLKVHVQVGWDGDASTWEAEAGKSEVQDHSLLHSQLRVHLGNTSRDPISRGNVGMEH